MNRAIIDLGAVAHNLHAVRSVLDETVKVMAVIKADAYGHGAVPVAQAVLEAGADSLAVATVLEGMELREAQIDAPVQVLNTLLEEEILAALAHNLILTIPSDSFAEKLNRAAVRAQKIARAHCVFDTGMGRKGFPPEDAAAQMSRVVRYSNIDVEGVYTHFPSAEVERDGFTQKQIRDFKTLLRELEDVGIPFEVGHAANSAGILNYPTSHFDMVRPGLLLYGVHPTSALAGKLAVKPALRLETRIVFLRDVSSGTPLGYGRTFTTSTQTKIATLPIGYGDGLPFHLSNNGDVLVRGQRAPIVGRISMDQTMIDVGHIAGVEMGETVTLIGVSGNQVITVEEIADRCRVVPHVVLTGISRRVRREYVTT